MARGDFRGFAAPYQPLFPEMENGRADDADGDDGKAMRNGAAAFEVCVCGELLKDPSAPSGHLPFQGRPMSLFRKETRHAARLQF